MTRFQYINKNIEQIKQETKMGWTSTTILNYYGIYSRYDHYRKRGNYVSLSAFYTSNDFGVSESLVYKSIKEMEAEV